MLKYKRVSLKLSGEAMGGHGETVDFEKVEAVARQIQSLQAPVPYTHLTLPTKA